MNQDQKNGQVVPDDKNKLNQKPNESEKNSAADKNAADDNKDISKNKVEANLDNGDIKSADTSNDNKEAADKKQAETSPDDKIEPDSEKKPENNSDNNDKDDKPEENDDDKPNDEDEMPKKSIIRKVLKGTIYTVGVVVVSVALAVFILFSISDFLGMFRPDATADITIPNNAATTQVASLLQKNGIIRSSFVFNLYLNVSKKHTFHKGVYTLNSSMSYQEILAELRSGSNSRSVVRVTIPEGYTIQRIGDLLQKEDICSKQDFLTAADNASIKFDFSNQITNDSDRFYHFEGYLFPDTYDFYVKQSADAVVSKMLKNFDKRFDAALRKKAAASGMTVDQVITLASIIQTESGKTSEMGKVSSVFHNRLKNGVSGKKMLQSDATILYVTKNNTAILSSEDTELSSAYNTYKHEGLPPGAICNPGLDAINAALNPDKTPYYFFVSDKKGKYYYAETYTEHLVNVQKAVETGQAIGTNVVN